MLQDQMYPQQGTVGEEGAGSMSAEEAIEAGKVELLTERPPEGLFGHTGRVLVEHGGKEALVAEGAIKAHLGHGGEILDPDRALRHGAAAGTALGGSLREERASRKEGRGPSGPRPSFRGSRRRKSRAAHPKPPARRRIPQPGPAPITPSH